VAYDAEFGNEFTTVWDDSRGGGLNVFQQRATGAGVLIGANAAVAANAPIESHAAIAYGEVSEHFFVVYVHEIDGIKGRAVWR
jgi:hypothetical protein